MTAPDSALAQELGPFVTRAAEGDADAFGVLVERTRGAVCAIALAIVRDVETSEDVAQEVFLAAWGGLRKLRNPASFLPWLRQTTRLRAAMALRGRDRRRRREFPADDLEATAGHLADARPDAVERLAREDERRLLAEALDELPDDAREIVALYYREGNSTAQVAALLDLSEEAVRKRLERARRQLRAHVLEKLGAALRGTAPTAAFTAGVLAALGTAPATAAGAAVTAAQGTAGTALLKASAPLGAALAGTAIGVAAAWLGIRAEIGRTADAAVRRDLARYRLAVIAQILVASAAWLFVGLVDWHRFAIYLGSGALFFGGNIAMWRLWYPRIIAPREAQELADDPGAAARLARERRARNLGFWGGMAGGLAGYLVGLWVLLRAAG